MDLNIEYLPPLMSSDQESQPVPECVTVDSDKNQPLSESSRDEASTYVQKAEPVSDKSIPPQFPGAEMDKSSDVEPLVEQVDENSSKEEPVKEPVEDRTTLDEPVTETLTDNSSNSQPKAESVTEMTSEGQPMTEYVSEKSNVEQPVIEAVTDKSSKSPPEWKTIQGTYIGVMLFIADYWSHKGKAACPESCMRLILNKPSGGLQLLGLLFRVMTQHKDAVSFDGCHAKPILDWMNSSTI